MALDTSDPTTAGAQDRAIYWRRTQRFTMLLLCVWFGVTFGVIFFARSLANFTPFGWSLSYYMAAQGTIFIYVIIVGIYAWVMPRLDRSLNGEDADGK
jgi:putative solute:sodium symporter small subunit